MIPVSNASENVVLKLGHYHSFKSFIDQLIDSAMYQMMDKISIL